MREDEPHAGEDVLLLDLDGDKNNLGGNGPPQPAGFVGFPQPPLPPSDFQPFNYPVSVHQVRQLESIFLCRFSVFVFGLFKQLLYLVCDFINLGHTSQAIWWLLRRICCASSSTATRPSC